MESIIPPSCSDGGGRGGEWRAEEKEREGEGGGMWECEGVVGDAG